MSVSCAVDRASGISIPPREPSPMTSTRSGRLRIHHLAIMTWALAAAAVMAGCGARADATQPDPAAVVRTLYQDHFAHQQNWTGTYGRQHALFAPELAAMLDADDSASAAKQNEVVGLDFDPLTYAQEEMTGFDVGAATRDGDDSLVPVVMRQDTFRTNLRVRLSRSDAGWRVKNIHYPEGDLVAILQQLAADRRRNP